MPLFLAKDTPGLTILSLYGPSFGGAELNHDVPSEKKKKRKKGITWCPPLDGKRVHEWLSGERTVAQSIWDQHISPRHSHESGHVTVPHTRSPRLSNESFLEICQAKTNEAFGIRGQAKSLKSKPHMPQQLRGNSG